MHHSLVRTKQFNIVEPIKDGQYEYNIDAKNFCTGMLNKCNNKLSAINGLIECQK